MYCKFHAYSFCIVVFFLIQLGCSPSTETETNTHDEQFVQIHLQYGFADELDTFRGTFTKDLVMDGSITVEFWLSNSEQDSIIQKAKKLSFFSLPDSLPATEGRSISPNPSPDTLQISYENFDKTVIWSYPLDMEEDTTNRVLGMSEYIMSIVRKSQIYKDLPAANGARL